MPPDEQQTYLDETTSALYKIVVQVKAWTIQKGIKAPQAAGKIHTDFEKGFIMAERLTYAEETKRMLLGALLKMI
ncbi:hypothetical protein PGB90_004667 [Kerria lacca]